MAVVLAAVQLSGGQESCGVAQGHWAEPEFGGQIERAGSLSGIQAGGREQVGQRLASAEHPTSAALGFCAAAAASGYAVVTSTRPEGPAGQRPSTAAGSATSSSTTSQDRSDLFSQSRKRSAACSGLSPWCDPSPRSRSAWA